MQSFKVTFKRNNKIMKIYQSIILGIVLEVISLIYLNVAMDKYQVTGNLRALLYFLNIIVVLYIPFALTRFKLKIAKTNGDSFCGVDSEEELYVLIHDEYIEFHFPNLIRNIFFEDIKKVKFEKDNIIIHFKDKDYVSFSVLENSEIAENMILERVEKKKSNSVDDIK
ncbi:MAG: hypothetical protein ACRCWG_06355 [Sarcina sp.]